MTQTASATYYIKSAKFTPSGGSIQTLTGIEEVTIRQGGQVVAHGTDGSITIMAHFLDNVEGQVTIRGRNGAGFVDTHLQPGAVGALEITMQQRKAGTGPVSGADEVITAANAMLASSNATLPHVDRSSHELEWHCSDPAGVAVFAFT